MTSTFQICIMGLDNGAQLGHFVIKANWQQVQFMIWLITESYVLIISANKGVSRGNECKEN